ncbi:diadenylate cyclase [Pelosinus sp. UFO1]|uniref:diadenylate cyclase n=1 Tax=Pelosinus sp. UFO1 TaxID=484770 RepID=UPI0004D14FA5|nr:diadenylate cyclase [Pelosinus sp. UFO1]AIF52983.1 protein of unknown function DUF147 [Pelosinus sp. UFO1]
MTLCQLDNQMKRVIRGKLEEVWHKSEQIVKSLDDGEKCLLCEITSIKDLALELDAMASLYHFQSSLFPTVEGIEDISTALTALSISGHGALIIIEQSDSLSEYVDACITTGSLIGARVSAPLLETIFYPGNPLHDGAVIIKDGQIVSAGCVLPLSAKRHTKEGRKIGTRHRAALGISERTDALAIVVSEETGKVSIVQRGILHPLEVNMCEHGEALRMPNFKLNNAPLRISTDGLAQYIGADNL